MINLLPAELGILIMEYLSLHEIAMVQRVCTQWRDFVRDNADSIYFTAAAFHGYNTSLDYNMKELCRRQRRLERAWAGFAPAPVSFHVIGQGRPSTPAVHRFKIDEKNKLVICSYRHSGIRVWDLETNIMIWELEDVQPFAHVEYSDGFLVFNDGAHKRVWRHSTEFDGPPPPPLNASYDTRNATKKRGVFRPWAELSSPQETNVFRLIYPTLITACVTDVYLWDISTGRMTCTVSNIQGMGWEIDIGPLSYVDFNQQHFVLCGMDGVGVYARPKEGQVNAQASELQVLLLSAKDYPPESTPNYSVSRRSPWTMGQPSIKLLPLDIDVANPAYYLVDEPPQFVAAHIDPTSTSLAVLLAHARLLFIPNLHISNPKERIQSFQLGPTHSFSEYLAFEHGRVAIATTRGIFIIHPERRSPLNPSAVLSPTRLCLVHALTNRTKLGVLSCLQLTEDGLWVNWGRDTNTKLWIFDDLRDDLLIDPMEYLRVSCVCRVNFSPGD